MISTTRLIKKYPAFFIGLGGLILMILPLVIVNNLNLLADQFEGDVQAQIFFVNVIKSRVFRNGIVALMCTGACVITAAIMLTAWPRQATQTRERPKSSD